MASVLIGIAAALALIAWILRGPGRRRPGPPIERHPGIDLDELEAAEREVRDVRSSPGTTASGGDDDEDDDWGPGAPRA